MGQFLSPFDPETMLNSQVFLVCMTILCCYSVDESSLTLCNPMDCSIPGPSVLYSLLESAQIHIHWVGNSIQPTSSSAAPFSFCLQSFPAPGFFLTSWLFASGGQSNNINSVQAMLRKKWGEMVMRWGLLVQITQEMGLSSALPSFSSK